MKTLMNKIFKSSILGALALVVLGILLIFESEATIVTISYVIGGENSISKDVASKLPKCK